MEEKAKWNGRKDWGRNDLELKYELSFAALQEPFVPAELLCLYQWNDLQL